jgi:integrase
VRLVEPPTYKRRKPATWNEEEVQTFLDLASRDRLHAVWRLSMYGLRRGEVMGLRWSDIDLDAKTLTVTHARLCINNVIRIEAPKSDNGIRTLPMDDELVAALEDLRRRQAEERLQAGRGDAADLERLGWYVRGDAYLAVDTSGYPVHPEWYSAAFQRMAWQAGLSRIRLS